MNDDTSFSSESTLSPARVQVVALVLLLPVLLVTVLPHWLIWGELLSLGSVSALSLLGLLIVSIVAHELLHGIGYAAGTASWQDVKFGFNREALAPYAHCKAPLRANTYRFAVALPALVLGVLPAIAGLATGSGGLTMYAALMLICAGGDFAVLWAIRRVPGTAWVQDHPHDIGALVLADGSSAPPASVPSGALEGESGSN